MPSGRTHDRITLMTLPIVTGLSLLISRSGDLTLWVSGGFLFSGLMFGPDLDIQSLQVKRWGILSSIWIPYRRLISHRSILSHGIIIGTIGRIIYLSIWLLLILGIYLTITAIITKNPNYSPSIINQLNQWSKQHYLQLIALIIGCELGAMSHYISDYIGSYLKRRSKRTKSRSKKKI